MFALCPTPRDLQRARIRFEELSSLRETVPEMQLELFREHAAMREQAAQELIDHLRCTAAHWRSCVSKIVLGTHVW